MSDTVQKSIHDTLAMESGALLEARDSLDGNALLNVLNAIRDCKGKVILSGCGTSGEAAKKIAHTLCCIECSALFLSPSAALHGGMGVLKKGDVAILISKGGQTGEINGMLDSLRRKQVTIIGVTENAESELARQSDIFLKIRVSREPDDFNMLATSSTLAVIAVFDAIAIAITRVRGYSKEEFAVIHPGGAVGVKLADDTK